MTAVTDILTQVFTNVYNQFFVATIYTALQLHASMSSDYATILGRLHAILHISAAPSVFPNMLH